MGKKPGTRTPRSVGAYGSTRGKERQRRRADNREQDPRYVEAMEETRAAQAELDARMEAEAVNPVLGHAVGALLMEKIATPPVEEVKERVEAAHPEAEVTVTPEAPESGKIMTVTVKAARKSVWAGLPATGDGNGLFTLGSARAMIRNGYNIRHVVSTTGFGTRHFDDLGIDEDGYGMSTEEFIGEDEEDENRLEDAELIRAIFNSRICMPLHRAGLKTIGDLRAKSHEELIKIPNLGPIALGRIEEAIA